jgi:hypothetical protein
MQNEHFPNSYAEDRFDWAEDKEWEYRERSEGRGRNRRWYYHVRVVAMAGVLCTTSSEKMAAWIVEIHNAGIGKDAGPKDEEVMGHGS